MLLGKSSVTHDERLHRNRAINKKLILMWLCYFLHTLFSHSLLEIARFFQSFLQLSNRNLPTSKSWTFSMFICNQFEESVVILISGEVVVKTS